MTSQRNNLEIYNDVAANWWSDDIRWVRTLKNLVPGRLKWFDRQTSWQGKTVLDLGCAGGFMAEALADRGAQVIGIDPAQDAIEAARRHVDISNLDITYDVGVGEQLPYSTAIFDILDRHFRYRRVRRRAGACPRLAPSSGRGRAGAETRWSVLV